MADLSGKELKRFMRHIDLPEIGEDGVQKLRRNKVLIIGMGGLGAPAALYLTGAGIGTIGIMDDDAVDESNLQRQIIYREDDTGMPKVGAAKARLEALSSHSEIRTYQERLNEENAHKIISHYDIILDGSDNFETRYLLSRACFEMKKPLISASAQGYGGQISTFKPYLDDAHPCYECIFPQDSTAQPEGNCSEAGILGPVTGIMGSLQATETIKELLGIGESLSGKLLTYSALRGEFKTIKAPKDPHCSLCGNLS